MAINPQELLDLAKRLVGPTPGALESDLRRGISTAYYAVFHMLINEIMTNFVTLPSFRPKVARALQHGTMKAVCIKYNPVKPNKASNQYDTPETDEFPSQVLTSELRQVASAFVQLHAAREEADYDGGSTIQHTAAATAIQLAEGAFQAWLTAQNEPCGSIFLQEMFFKSIVKR